MKSTARWVFVMAGLLALLVSTVATVAGSSAAGASGSNSSLLGPTKKATGQPLKVGFIYSGQSQTADYRNELPMGQATVKYINNHLGGVAGRPLQLVVCADNQSPSMATDCANQMVAAHVPVVLQALPTQPAAVMQVLGPAKIPYFVEGALDQSILESPYGYVLGNPLGVFASSIRAAEQSGAKKVGVVVFDVPAAAGLGALVTPLYKANGLVGTTTLVPVGTPDMTPQIQAAMSQGDNSFLVIGNPPFCLSALKAIKTLSFNGPVVIIPQCLSPSMAKQLPGGLNGVEMAAQEEFSKSSSQTALYHAVAATYAPGIPPDTSSTPATYDAILAWARAMNGLNPSDVTAATVQQQLSTMKPEPLPLLPGQTFQCNRQQVTLTPAVCSTGVATLTFNAAGNVKKTETFSAAPYLHLG